MVSKSIISLISITLISYLLTTAEARKSYLVKENIHHEGLKVYRPRVKSADVQWCMFKDSNNDWCMDANEDWTLSVNNEYTYSTATGSDGTPPAYMNYHMYNSTQSLEWSSTFNLARLYYSSMKLSMSEFSTGFRFEVFYWLNSYSYCLNLVQFSTPITMSLVVDNKLEQCSKTLIDCFDNWDIWTSSTADMLEQCSLSSGAEFTMYEYKPVTENYDDYWLGSALYNQAICFPGFSPFYSYQEQYPDNFFYQLNQMWEHLLSNYRNLSAVTAGAAIFSFVQNGIAFNDLAMKGPIPREHNMEDLQKMTTDQAKIQNPHIKF